MKARPLARVGPLLLAGLLPMGLSGQVGTDSLTLVGDTLVVYRAKDFALRVPDGLEARVLGQYGDFQELHLYRDGAFFLGAEFLETTVEPAVWDERRRERTREFVLEYVGYFCGRPDPPDVYYECRDVAREREYQGGGNRPVVEFDMTVLTRDGATLDVLEEATIGPFFWVWYEAPRPRIRAVLFYPPFPPGGGLTDPEAVRRARALTDAVRPPPLPEWTGPPEGIAYEAYAAAVPSAALKDGTEYDAPVVAELDTGTVVRLTPERAYGLPCPGCLLEVWRKVEHDGREGWLPEDALAFRHAASDAGDVVAYRWTDPARPERHRYVLAFDGESRLVDPARGRVAFSSQVSHYLTVTPGRGGGPATLRVYDTFTGERLHQDLVTGDAATFDQEDRVVYEAYRGTDADGGAVTERVIFDPWDGGR